MSREVNFFLRLRSGTQTVSSACTTAQYLPQTGTCSMDEHPQNRQRSQSFYACSLVLIICSCFMTIAGAINVGFGTSRRNEPDWLKKQGQIQMNAGVGLLVPGIVVLVLSSTWACYVQHKLSGSWHPSLATVGPTNSNVNASNTASTLEIQPSIIHGPVRLPIYEYSYRQQAGSIQQVQTGTNQYTPALLALNHLAPVQTNRYASAPADQPPPSYNKVMEGLR